MEARRSDGPQKRELRGHGSSLPTTQDGVMLLPPLSVGHHSTPMQRVNGRENGGTVLAWMPQDAARTPLQELRRGPKGNTKSCTLELLVLYMLHLLSVSARMEGTSCSPLA